MKPNTVSFTTPTDYSVESQRIERNRKLAELLRQQADQPVPSGQMAGGYFVPTSPLNYLAQAVKSYGAVKGLNKADEEAKALANRVTTDRRETLAKALKLGLPTPARPGIPSPPDELGGGPALPAQAATPGDPMAAMGLLAQSQDPMLSQLGTQQMLSHLIPKAPQRVDLGDRIGLINEQGQIVGSLPKGVTPDTTVREVGLDRRFAGVSGNTQATVNAANQRHNTPSGSAILGSQTALQTHATPSGSAQLSAQTAMRGQDMSAERLGVGTHRLPDGSTISNPQLMQMWKAENNLMDPLDLQILSKTDPARAAREREKVEKATPLQQWARQRFGIDVTGGFASAPQPAPSPMDRGSAGQRKTLNGKNYVKINGQWFEE